jgi:hypothetical protein
VQSLTRSVVGATTAALLLIRREALTALGYEELTARNKPYVGLHSPDADAIYVIT